MKYTFAALVAAASIANAQVVFNNTSNTFQCLGDAAGKNFCAGDSLQTNIIIRCSGTTGQPGNCNDNLAGVPPVGVKTFAPCYQTSNTSGDAACSYNGIAYPDGGKSFPIPGASSSSSAASASSTSSTSSATTSTSCSTSSTSAVSTTTPCTTTTVSSSAAGYTVVPVTSSTLKTTVYGTTTVTSSCSTSSTATGTGAPAPIHNTTTYTTGLPQPTPVGSGAVALQGGIFAGILALAAAMLL